MGERRKRREEVGAQQVDVGEGLDRRQESAKGSGLMEETEFGGKDGIIQGPPHEMSAREQRMQLMRTDTGKWDAPFSVERTEGVNPLKPGERRGSPLSD